MKEQVKLIGFRESDTFKRLRFQNKKKKKNASIKAMVYNIINIKTYYQKTKKKLDIIIIMN